MSPLIITVVRVDSRCRPLSLQLSELTVDVASYLYSCHELTVDVASDHEAIEDTEEEEVFQGHTDTLDYPLDPKQRRATVSGGSPTLTRPSIIVDDFEVTPLRLDTIPH